MPSDPTHFYSRTRDARKVIVVDLGFLGDTVHLVPALWELKRNYPQAELHVLTSPVGADVLRLVPCVACAWSLKMYRGERTLAEQWRVIRALRREKFDLAVNFSGADRTIFMTALTGARWRVAHSGGRWHFYNRWLVRDWVPRQPADLLVYEQRRRVLASCGMALEEARFDLRLPGGLQERIAQLVPPFAAHLSPNASTATREWPLEHHAAMLRMVWKDFPHLKVLASSGGRVRELQRLHSLAETVKDSRLQILPDGLSIPELAGVLTRCKLHIGPDSGVLHLAVALGVPTISFFREQATYGSFRPVGARHQVICMPCHCIDHRDALCERLGHAECFDRIEPARVAELVRQQLSSQVYS